MNMSGVTSYYIYEWERKSEEICVETVVKSYVSVALKGTTLSETAGCVLREGFSVCAEEPIRAWKSSQEMLALKE